MDVQPQQKLKFEFVGYPRLKFKTVGVDTFVDEGKVDYTITPSVYFPKDDEQKFYIITDLYLKVDNGFDLYVRAVAHFRLEGEIDAETKKAFINANAPAISFPYIRSFVSLLSVNLGCINPIMLPTQFFRGELPVIEMGEDDDDDF